MYDISANLVRDIAQQGDTDSGQLPTHPCDSRCLA